MGTSWQGLCPALVLVWVVCGAPALGLGNGFLYPDASNYRVERKLGFEGNSNHRVDGGTSSDRGVYSEEHLYKTYRGYSKSDLSLPELAPKYYNELSFREADASGSSPFKSAPEFINMAAGQDSSELENEVLGVKAADDHLWDDVLTDVTPLLVSDVNWRADPLDNEHSFFNVYGVFHLSKSGKGWSDESPGLILPPKNESSCGEAGAHHPRHNHHHSHSVKCNMANMTVVFKGHQQELFVQAHPSTILNVFNLLHKCKYEVKEKSGSFQFTTSYNGCYVKKLGDCFVLNLVWKNKTVVLSCPAEPTPSLLTFCQSDKMTIVLPEGPLDLLKVKDRFNQWITIHKIAHRCKYLIWRDLLGRIVFSASFKACHVKETKEEYVLVVRYESAGVPGQVVMSCPVESHVQHPHLDFPTTLCGMNGIIIHLPKQNLQAIQLKDAFGNAVNIEDIAEDCDFRVIHDKASVTLIASFESCNVKLQGKHHLLTVQYVISGMTKSVHAQCHQLDKPRIHCRASGMTIELPHGPLEKVFIKTQLNQLVAVRDAPKYCRYHLVRDHGINLLTASYLSCDVKTVNYNYILPVFYMSASGKQGSVNMECPATTGKPRVICRRSSMTVYLPNVPLEQIRLRNHHGKIVAIHAVKHCHYILMEGNHHLIFTTSYKACDVQIKNGHYILTVVYGSGTKGEASVEMKCPVEETESIPSHTVTCGKSGMSVLLPKGSTEDVKIIDYLGNEVAVRNVPKHCQYVLEKHSNGSVSFTAHYRSCDVKMQGGYFMLTVLYKPLSGPRLVGHMRCLASDHGSHIPHDLPVVICESTNMKVQLLEASEVRVLDAHDKEHNVLKIARECSYEIKKKGKMLLFTTAYHGCHIKVLHDHYSLTVVYRSIGGDNVWLQMKCPVQAHPGRPTPPVIVPTKPLPHVACKNDSMTLMLPDCNLDGITVKDAFGQDVQVEGTPSYCGYSLIKGHGKINFTILYGACDVSIEHGNYVLTVGYKVLHGPKKYITLRCPVPARPTTTPIHSSTVICRKDGMLAVLPDGLLNLVKIIDVSNKEQTVIQAPVECGYGLVKTHGKITLSVQYTSCDVAVKHNMYWLTVLYTPAKGPELSLNMSCPVVPPSVPTSSTVRPPVSHPTVICGSSSMRVLLPNGSPNWVNVIKKTGDKAKVVSQPKSCGYVLEKGHNYLSFTTPYQACDVQILGSFYVLTVIYAPEVGPELVVKMKCPTASGDFSVTTLPPLTSQKPSTIPPSPTVFCKAASMMLVLPGLPNEIQILDQANEREPVNSTSRACGYIVTKRDGNLIFSAVYDACDVLIQHHHYVLTVLYKPSGKPWKSVTMRCPVKVPTSPPTKPTAPSSVTCRAQSMMAMLPDGPTGQVKVIDSFGEAVAVSGAASVCGYGLTKVKGKILLTVPYNACDVSVESGDYVLVVLYQPVGGMQKSMTLRCPAGDHTTTSQGPTTATITTFVHSTKKATTHRSESTPKSTSGPPPNVVCRQKSMMAILPNAFPDSVRVIDQFMQEVTVITAPVSCGYQLVIGYQQVVFLTPYVACNVRIVDGFYVLAVLYTTKNGQQKRVSMKCSTLSGDMGLSTTVAPTSVMKSTPRAPSVLCNASTMSVMLDGSSRDVFVLDIVNEAVPVNQVSSRCGYVLTREPGGLLLTAQYTSCDVRIKNHFYILSVLYTPAGGEETSVNMKCPVIQPPTTMSTTTTMPGTPSIPLVICQEFTMEAILPAGLLSQVKITDSFNQSMAVNQAPNECGYTLRKAGGKIVFSTPYNACDVYVQYNGYILTVLYQPYGHPQKSVTMSCPVVEPTEPTSAAPTTVTSKPTTSIPPPKALCRGSSMMVVLPSAAPENVKIIDKLHHEVPVITAPRSCGYTLVKQYKQLVFASLYTACDVQIKGGFYVLMVVYTTPSGVKMKVPMKCPTTGSLFPTTLAPKTSSIWTTPSAPILVCKASNMMVLLPMGSINDVKIIDQKNEALPVVQAPRNCGYVLEKRSINLAFLAIYTSCNIKILRNHYVLHVLYTPSGGMEMSMTMRCPVKVPTTTKVPSTTSTLTTKAFTPIVICRSSSMMVTLPDGSPQSVSVLDVLGEQVAVTQQPSSCGYTLVKKQGNLQFTALNQACDVQIIGGSYVLLLIYQPQSGPQIVARMECPVTSEDPGLTTAVSATIATSTTILPTSATPTVICNSTNMTAMLPDGSLDAVEIIDLAHEVVPVKLMPQGCGYTLERKQGYLSFVVQYTACDINILNNKYILMVLYKPTGRSMRSLTMSCPVGIQPTMTTTLSKPYTPSPPVTCGNSSMSVALPDGPLDQVKIVSFNETVAVYEALPECGYILRRVGRKMVLKVPYDACDVYTWRDNYVVMVLYMPAGGVQNRVTMRCPIIKPSPPTTTMSTRMTTHSPSSAVICRGSNMTTDLPGGALEEVYVIDKHYKEVAVVTLPKSCGYTLVKRNHQLSFTALYKSCHVRISHHHYVLTVYYKTAKGASMVVDMKCPLLFTPSTPVPVKPGIPPVMCHKSAMSARLPTASVQLVKILDKVGKEVSVVSLASKCGYHLVKEERAVYFSVPYTACDVKILDHHYVLTVIYTSFAGYRMVIRLRCPVPAPSPIEAGVSCLEDCMSIELPLGPLNEVKVVGSLYNFVVVNQAPKSCGYSLVEKAAKLVFTVAYKGCHVKTVGKHYELTIVHLSSTGEKLQKQMMCPVQRIVAHQGCNLPRNKQVTCGPPGAKPHSCLAHGCCVDEETLHCYYPMDTCTADGHFVFAVYRTASKPEVDPATLVVSGNQSCLPVICTPEFAIFKFPVTGCGTYVFVIAETTIYVAEVQGLIRRKLQMFGQITRDSPFRLQVECRYSKGSLASTGYLVMNVSPPPASISSEQLGVSLRIAKDESYSSFYPYSQVPLSLLLSKKVYLQLQLVNPPEPNMVLLVHYCIAYPRSSMNAWVLIYEGCPNKESAVNLILKDIEGHPLPKYLRRFDLHTFQFLDPKSQERLDEEVYFMCSTEACSSSSQFCNEGCFDGRIMATPASESFDGRCSGKLCPRHAIIAKRAIEGSDAVNAMFNSNNVPAQADGNTLRKWILPLVLGLLSLITASALFILRNLCKPCRH
ncbi:ZP4 protein, partial [Polypterus senegalus]|nr:ZP4 protein [Polypterus senegalus]